MRVGRRGFLGALLAAPLLSKLLPKSAVCKHGPFGPFPLDNLTDDGTLEFVYSFVDANTGLVTPVSPLTAHAEWNRPTPAGSFLYPYDPGCVGACKSEVGAG